MNGVDSGITDDWIENDTLKTVADATLMVLTAITAGLLVALIAVIMIAPVYFLPGILVDVLTGPESSEAMVDGARASGVLIGGAFDVGVGVTILMWMDGDTEFGG